MSKLENIISIDPQSSPDPGPQTNPVLNQDAIFTIVGIIGMAIYWELMQKEPRKHKEAKQIKID